ncbi:unnamed protein product [Caenorhabditis nigoni]
MPVTPETFGSAQGSSQGSAQVAAMAHWEYKWFECAKGSECQFLGQTKREMKDHWMLWWIGKMVNKLMGKDKDKTNNN